MKQRLLDWLLERYRVFRLIVSAGFQAIVVDVDPGLATMPALEAVCLNDQSSVFLITTDQISDKAPMRIALQSPAR